MAKEIEKIVDDAKKRVSTITKTVKEKGAERIPHTNQTTFGLLNRLGNYTLAFGTGIINTTRHLLRSDVAVEAGELAQNGANKLAQQFGLSDTERKKIETSLLKYFKERKNIRATLLHDLKASVSDEKYSAIEEKMNRWQRWLY